MKMRTLGLGASFVLMLLVGSMACEGNPDLPKPPRSSAAVAPPPISGGTLIVARDGRTAVASDPDRDRVYLADLDRGVVRADLALEADDEPGRIAEDAHGRAHVALRRGGDLVTIDLAAGEILRRTPVCSTPRGVAYDEAADELVVACTDGALVTFDAESGTETSRRWLELDLRDVVVRDGRTFVSLFRSAELLEVDGDAVVRRRRPGSMPMPGFDPSSGELREDAFTPAIAWRVVPMPRGLLMVHQRGNTGEIPITPMETGGGYGSSGCGSIVQSTVSVFGDDEGRPDEAPALGLMTGVLPVDAAVSPGGQLAVALAGSNAVRIRPAPTPDDATSPGDCFDPSEGLDLPASPIAVAFRGEELVIQMREPARLQIRGGKTIPLSNERREDMGHELFHNNPAQTLACASCHPEGREDGRTWVFQDIGPRRTQNIGGGVTATAPLHWDGDMPDFTGLVHNVFEGRMGAPPVTSNGIGAMATWIDSLPVLPPLRSAEDEAVRRGQAIFESAEAACATCHAGTHLTDNQNRDIGKGRVLQVPSLLGVAHRAPFMHDGCATTLRDRFTPSCGGERHGNVAQLDEGQFDDLIAYLESL